MSLTLVQQCKAWFEAGHDDKIIDTISSWARRHHYELDSTHAIAKEQGHERTELIDVLFWLGAAQCRLGIKQQHKQRIKVGLRLLLPLYSEYCDDLNYFVSLALAFEYLGQYEQALYYLYEAAGQFPKVAHLDDMIVELAGKMSLRECHSSFNRKARNAWQELLHSVPAIINLLKLPKRNPSEQQHLKELVTGPFTKVCSFFDVHIEQCNQDFYFYLTCHGDETIFIALHQLWVLKREGFPSTWHFKLGLKGAHHICLNVDNLLFDSNHTWCALEALNPVKALSDSSMAILSKALSTLEPLTPTKPYAAPNGFFSTAMQGTLNPADQDSSNAALQKANLTNNLGTKRPVTAIQENTGLEPQSQVATTIAPIKAPAPDYTSTGELNLIPKSKSEAASSEENNTASSLHVIEAPQPSLELSEQALSPKITCKPQFIASPLPDNYLNSNLSTPPAELNLASANKIKSPQQDLATNSAKPQNITTTSHLESQAVTKLADDMLHEPSLMLDLAPPHDSQAQVTKLEEIKTQLHKNLEHLDSNTNKENQPKSSTALKQDATPSNAGFDLNSLDPELFADLFESEEDNQEHSLDPYCAFETHESSYHGYELKVFHPMLYTWFKASKNQHPLVLERMMRTLACYSIGELNTIYYFGNLSLAKEKPALAFKLSKLHLALEAMDLEIANNDYDSYLANSYLLDLKAIKTIQAPQTASPLLEQLRLPLRGNMTLHIHGAGALYQELQAGETNLNALNLMCAGCVPCYFAFVKDDFKSALHKLLTTNFKLKQRMHKEHIDRLVDTLEQEEMSAELIELMIEHWVRYSKEQGFNYSFHLLGYGLDERYVYLECIAFDILLCLHALSSFISEHYSELHCFKAGLMVKGSQSVDISITTDYDNLEHT